MKRKIGLLIFWQLGLAAALSCGTAGAAESVQQNSDKLVVHEWGTFTTLQDDAGQQLGGINIDDEPLPPFVHSLHSYVLGRQHATWSSHQQKGAPPNHPYVTMRLETPVIYFYPPKLQSSPLKLDVDVQFRGGWLTQFYPFAQADAPGLKKNEFKFGPIDCNTIGRLTWRNLLIGSSTAGPKTEEPVWLTPRNVQSANVSTPRGESEKYLFYRGVGNIESPLSVLLDRTRNTIGLRANFAAVLKPGESATIPKLWLVHVRSDGATAYRTLDSLTVNGEAADKLAADSIRSDFAEGDYSSENLQKLQTQMHAALVRDGLFDEEATAMLQTWQNSYFASGGLRLFYVVPRAWTEHYLPLAISQDCELKRTMVARTELISAEQTALLEQLATAKISNPSWINELKDSPSVKKFREGRSSFGDLGVPIPPDFQLYLDMGRFRNALVLHFQETRKSAPLGAFISLYDLRCFQPPKN